MAHTCITRNAKHFGQRAGATSLAVVDGSHALYTPWSVNK